MQMPGRPEHPATSLAAPTGRRCPAWRSRWPSLRNSQGRTAEALRLSAGHRPCRPCQGPGVSARFAGIISEEELLQARGDPGRRRRLLRPNTYTSSTTSPGLFLLEPGAAAQGTRRPSVPTSTLSNGSPRWASASGALSLRNIYAEHGRVPAWRWAVCRNPWKTRGSRSAWRGFGAPSRPTTRRASAAKALWTKSTPP